MLCGKKLRLISQVPFTETAGSVTSFLQNARDGLLIRVEPVSIFGKQYAAPGADRKSHSLRVASGHQRRSRG